MERITKDNAEAGQKSSYYKTNYKESKISLALDQLIRAEQILTILCNWILFGGTGALEAARNVKG
jgi:hypothetical protein